jgi:hypothetical protein
MDLVKLGDLAGKSEWSTLDREIGRLKLPDTSPKVRGALDALHAEAKYLDQLALLQNSLSLQPGTREPDAEQVATALESLQGKTGDTPLARRVQNDLIARAKANGHPDLARKVRDVKLLAAKPEGGAPESAPALGKTPVPEAPAGGPKPGPHEEPTKRLPSLGDKPAPSGKSSRERVGEELNEQVSAHRAVLTDHLLHLHDLTQGRKEKEKEGDPDSHYQAEVKRALGRELTASERMLAREMRRQGKPSAACAEVLRDLAARKV